MRPSITFDPQNTIFPIFITHFKEKAFPPEHYKDHKGKGISMKKNLLHFVAILLKKKAPKEIFPSSKKVSRYF